MKLTNHVVKIPHHHYLYTSFFCNQQPCRHVSTKTKSVWLNRLRENEFESPEVDVRELDKHVTKKHSCVSFFFSLVPVFFFCQFCEIHL